MPKGIYTNAHRKAWTPDEAMLVTDLIEQGRSTSEIAKRLKRSNTSVEVWLKRNVKRRQFRPLSARRVADTLGVPCSKTVTRWIEAGWLRGRHSRIGAGAGRRWLVSEDALTTFMEAPEHWHLWDAERVPDADLREWTLRVRQGERFMPLTEVAERFCVEPETVGTWLDRGYLRHVDYGNRKVPESALVGFVPPHEWSRKGRPARRFTADEDLLLIRMRARGAGWTEIACALERHPSVIHARWHRLNADRAGAA